MSSSKFKKIHFTTLGCSKNQVDTEVMANLVLRQGLVLTANPEEADLIAVNTCAFLQASKEESIDTILNLAKYRETGSCKKLVVTGCLPSRHPEEMKEALPEVDHFLGTNDLHRFAELLQPSAKPKPITLISKGEHAFPKQDILGERFLDQSLYTRYMKIAEGCDRSCSFCIIPHIRGPQKSRTIESLVTEAKNLVASGAKEINLIAQDLTAYGHDLPQTKRLEDLLECLIAIKGLHWLRLHYAYPQRISDRLIDLMSRGLPLLPYLDMPVQHINNRILKRMNRGTTGEKLRETIHKLRARIPNLALRTTLIVGFPGETEEEFEELLAFLEETRFDHVGAFRYSREEGTEAAKLDGQLPEKTKHARYERLMAQQNAISRKMNQERIGKDLEVLVIGPSEESEYLITARAQHQAGDVDGFTYMTDLGAESPELKPGELRHVRIEAAHDYDLAGSLLPIQ